MPAPRRHLLHPLPLALRAPALLLATLLAVSSGCEPDVVEPNGYVRGAPPAGTGGTSGAATATGGGAGQAVPGAGGVAGDGSAPGAADARPSDGAGSAPPGPTADCDLSGRWLVAQRVLAVAIGQEQAALSWFYWEVEQQGAQILVKKGLHCGFAVVKKTGLAANVDSSAAWPALLTRNTSTGRRGRFVKEGSGCRLSVDKEYVVRGATLPHYGDPAQKLPTRTEKGEAGRPGWEDWDGDGQPGISLKVSSPLASGTLYTCQRDFTVYDGPTASRSAKLKVAITYGGEQVPLGRSPGSAQAIESSSSPSSDSSQHFAVLHRLAADQAVGDDAAICAAVRTLRTSLAPEAGQ